MDAADTYQERPIQALSSDKIGFCIEELNSLKRGAEAVPKLIACGRSAIEPLRQFLLQGTPSVVYHSRLWAVQALAGLGAGDVLLEYLKGKKDIEDPPTRLSEEVVESAAARELVQWPSEEVFQVLINLARQRCLPGVLETLGKLRKPEAVPYLVKALEDDVCRSAAEDALREIGLAAKQDLIVAAMTPRPSRDEETPSSLLRRLSSLKLLAEMWISPYDWRLLRPLLNESDGEILIALFKIAIAGAGERDRTLAFRLLTRAIENANWYLKSEIENALAGCFHTIRPLIEEEILSRHQRCNGKDVNDPVLTTLLRVKDSADTHSGREKGRKGIRALDSW